MCRISILAYKIVHQSILFSTDKVLKKVINFSIDVQELLIIKCNKIKAYKKANAPKSLQGWFVSANQYKTKKE